NHVDDDCDGSLDEALMRPCGSDVGVCQAGSETCAAGTWVDCSAIGPSPERCNDLDDDCDGSLDEGLRCAPPCEEGIAAGWGHTCARLETGEVWCWGADLSGQLGTGKGDPRDWHVPVPVKAAITGALDVAAGASKTCARLEAGEVRCWGHQVVGFEGITPILVPGVMHASEISIAVDHICARLRGGELMCWGKNLYGQLGNGAQTRLLELPVFVSGVRDAVSVHAERSRSCALLRTGQLSCWGLVNGELALAPVTVVTLANAAQISFGEHHTCALLVNGQVQCWQTGPRNRMPETVANLDGAAEIGLGAFHTCARLRSGQVRCWGSNQEGQLGDGSLVPSGTPVTVSGITDAVDLAVDAFHSCARLGTGELMCWGRNKSGQLGDGTTIQRATPVRVKGLKMTACRPSN
ncbi:MAG: hypothetical protein MJD61_16620, partial [Proteobacteria bacterium]|nr:hypothetical protein [Pseudomonadota bacterium]